jgi:hypothetical protein
MLHVPDELAPADGEAAVLSMLAVRQGTSWVLIAGSLLTVPIDVAFMSWKRWGELQPEARRHASDSQLDIGPIFCAEPFERVRIVRAIIAGAEWRQWVEKFASGDASAPSCRCDAVIAGSTSTVLLGRDGSTEAHLVVDAAKRPTLGVVFTLDAPEMPPTQATWELAAPTYMTPGPDLGAMFPHRHLVHWAGELLGIDWPPGAKIAPPARFVIGRTQSRAWIARVKPDYDAEQLVVSIGWDEQLIDPLGCSLLTRAERDGTPLLVRHQSISDFPGTTPASPEPRDMSWHQRTLDITLPRGPRNADWGILLLGPDGELLDELPVVPRVERINLSLQIIGSSAPPSVSTVGEQKPPPSDPERDEAVRAAIEAEAGARSAAAHRRISTAGQLEDYLRWRFACRAGELLLLDPYLLDDKPEQVLTFLGGLNRPIRALTRTISPETQERLSATPQIDARPLPNGKGTLHDRIWIVGETGILVGASVGSFLADPAGAPRRATTATDLPFADAAIWKERFEEWWPR